MMNSLAFVFLAFASTVLATTTTINNHPYHASIEIGARHMCSGALIKPDVVLTTASCVQDATKDYMKVRVGSDELVNGGTVMDVSAIVPHKRYQSNRKDYDIALVILTTSVSASSSIQVIDLPRSLHSPQIGSEAILTGFGIDDEDNLTDTLSKTSLQVSVTGKCKNAYADQFIYITDRMFCAEPANSGRACKGDLGSPLVADGKLIGLSVYNKKCGSIKYPGIYTDVASLRKWIDEQNE